MTLAETISAAIRYFEEHGYSSADAVDQWAAAIKKAAQSEMVSEKELAQVLTRTLTKDYDRVMTSLKREERKVPQFTLRNVQPKMRAELDRRIMASAQLIKLNREEAIEKTLRRFRGWATSVPVGGSEAVEINPVKQEVKKALKQLPFVERRVLIDQGHKLISSVNEIAAVGNGAIAMRWDSRWREAGYDYRQDHKERDGHVYLIRGSWADERGLVKPIDGYSDELTKPGEEVFCRCKGVYIYSLGKLPSDMLTAKGRAEQERAREIIRGLSRG